MMKTRSFHRFWIRPNFFNLILLCIFLCMMVLISLNIDDGNTLVTRDISMRRPMMMPMIPKYKSSFDLSKLEDNDKSQLIDLKDFRFLINNLPCHRSSSSLLKTVDNTIVIENGNNSISPDDDSNSVDIFLLIFIHSAPNNFKKRKIIRDTWASSQNISFSQIRRVFLLGLVDDIELQRSINQENKIHGDIIQGNFVDTYRNLTYKHVMGLKWITYYCRSAKFVLKTDDDIFVDTYQLINHLKGLMINSLTQPKRLINCFVVRNPYPKRSANSKWKVTYQEFPGKHYPDYCSGWVIIFTSYAVFELYLQSTSTLYFWVDDVYVTGLLADKAAIDRTDLGSKLTLIDKNIEKWSKAKKTLSLPPMFARPAAIKDLQIIYDLWNKTIRYYQFVT
ncbi:beta-1,3-galactosyltransferase 5-like [Panonychus citri]|uniref:beta-1,3-galactosyltransferase 5-like n=1 Tax=Panonychus citri TaxID=50023 RepID=UPI0023080F9A|nr:beta-1,3-galactosyltransferase 5-like [Panonychus citri]